jgi:hypothetical protein
MYVFFAQSTRALLKKHIEEFGNNLKKETEVGLVIDGQVCVFVFDCECIRN